MINFIKTLVCLSALLSAISFTTVAEDKTTAPASTTAQQQAPAEEVSTDTKAATPATTVSK